ncbi:MAG: response regulator, partial [Methylococcaceae bacterium]
ALFAETELKIIEAENGLDAVNLAKQQLFDLVLMDIRMPVMDGYKAAKEIKLFSEVPIVALTASVMTDEFERLKSNDFDGYLRKPVLKKALFNELCKFLPFEEKVAIKFNNEQDELLNDDEVEILPVALVKLTKLKEQCRSLSNTNNISDIKIFAYSVLEIVKQYPIKVIKDFAGKLIEQLDSYDIGAIKRSLNHYPVLIKQLEQFNHSNKKLDIDDSCE